TGAKAGWVGLVQTNGQLSFPAVLGDFAKEWLTKQQGLDSLWGFTFREDTATLVNDVPPVPGFSEPAINSILSCPIFQEGKPIGQLVLANKPAGFTSHDASVLQGMAHLVAHYLSIGQEAGEEHQAEKLAVLWQPLNKLEDAVFAVAGQSGRLLFANAA